MKDNTIVSLADSNYFELLNELIDSIKKFDQSKSLAICILDAGLTDEQKKILSFKVDEIKIAEWDIEVPGFKVMGKEWLKSQVSRAFLPNYFPDYKKYLWIDCDAWVQEWSSIELYFKGCNNGKLSIATEVGVDCQGENNSSKYALMVNGFKDNGSGGIDVVDTEGGVGIGFSRNYSDVGASIVHDSYASTSGNYCRGSLKFFNKNANTSGAALTECFEIVGSHSGLVRAKAGGDIDSGVLSGIFCVSLESFCLNEPEAAFLGFANLFLKFLKSLF